MTKPHNGTPAVPRTELMIVIDTHRYSSLDTDYTIFTNKDPSFPFSLSFPFPFFFLFFFFFHV